MTRKGELMKRAALLATVAVAFAAFAASAQAGGAVFLSKRQYGKAWPLTVASGTVACSNNEVTFTARGIRYAVNGTAMMRHRGADIRRIWRRDPVIPGARVDISPIIDRGLALC